MTTILEKALQVAAEFYDSIGYYTVAKGIRTDPNDSMVYALLEHLHAANLLAREPRKLTDEDLCQIMRDLDKEFCGTPMRGSHNYTMAAMRRSAKVAYPDCAAKEKALADAREKIAELETNPKQPTFCGPNLRSAQSAVTHWRDSNITSEARIARNFINNCKPLFEVEAPLRKEIAELKATNTTQASKIRAFVALAEKHGWNGVENSKILDVFLDDLITDQAEEIEHLRGELAVALDAREKRVCELLAKLDRGEDKACIELYSNGTVQIANADGDILDVQAMGMGEAITALEKLTAEKKPEPTPEENNPGRIDIEYGLFFQGTRVINNLLVVKARGENSLMAFVDGELSDFSREQAEGATAGTDVAKPEETDPLASYREHYKQLEQQSEWPQWWEYNRHDGDSHYFRFDKLSVYCKSFYENGRPHISGYSLDFISPMSHRIPGKPEAVRKWEEEHRKEGAKP